MISEQDLIDLTHSINAKVEKYHTSFHLTFHFANERVNDPRNQPQIELAELESIFERVIEKYIMAIVAMDNNDTFVISCQETAINIPCIVQKKKDMNGGISHKSIVITIMRKKAFGIKPNDVMLIV